MEYHDQEKQESPQFVRMSLAAAMTLDLKPGIFFRNAKLYCINLLLTYKSGCAARCAYCGLSNKRPGSYGSKSFIRVTWPTYTVKEVIARIAKRQKRVKRICVSMITNKRSVADTKKICADLRAGFDIPVSLLIAPTILDKTDLFDFKKAGADKIGVAIDLATPDLFDKFRGTGVSGPHKWNIYWKCLSDCLEIFGPGNAGAHFIAGMGETEEQMCRAMEKVRIMGGSTHLFSFFPEANSATCDHKPPGMDTYRRIQIARFLIDNQVRSTQDFTYKASGSIVDFGLSRGELDQIIDSGEPFRTSGCNGYDGQVACNRPYANSRPGPDIRNFPFAPGKKDIKRIREQMGPLL